MFNSLIFHVDYDQDLFSEVREDMIEACSLSSFSTTTPVSSSESRNSAKEVIEEFDFVVVDLRSFWPSSASACCSAVFNWWRCSLREAGLVSLKSVSLPCLLTIRIVMRMFVMCKMIMISEMLMTMISIFKISVMYITMLKPWCSLCFKIKTFMMFWSKIFSYDVVNEHHKDKCLCWCLELQLKRGAAAVRRE